MKRKIEWAVLLFIVCVIFVFRFGVLERPRDFWNIGVFTRSSIEDIRAYWPPALHANNSLDKKSGSFDGLLSPAPESERSNGTSAAISTFLGAWSGLKLVYNRSDLSVEMLEGFRDGAVSWRDLKKYSEQKKALEVGEPKRCPYSVNSVDTAELAAAGGVQFPCGLIVDSSITVIASVTSGGSADFTIELVGPQASSEAPPVIWHFNVRILGDKLTNQPVIIQNTWSSSTSWGDEQRCPYADGQRKEDVDGMETCIDQVGKALTWQPSGERISESSKWANMFKGSESSKTWFPFAEGMPFAATIWVGWEGFHMTVNGKHISSFQYRKGLEPWLVDRLLVKGDIRISSAIAVGLPASESVEESAGLEILKAPPLPPTTTQLKLFVGVFSTTNNFDRRMALRRSWMQYEEIRNSSVVVRFFVGLHKQKQVNKEMWDEAKNFGDIQLLPFVDYYDLITLKTLAICVYATKYVNADYIMKTDDDSFVRIDGVLGAIRARRSTTTKSLLLGEVEVDSGPHRDTNSKWYITEKEWEGARYPPWAHGPGYVVSADIAKYVSEQSKDERLKLFKLEDVAMGIWVDEYRRTRKRAIEYVSNKQFVSGGCSDDYIVAHYQNPRQMMCLWRRLRETSKAVCCD